MDTVSNLSINIWKAIYKFLRYFGIYNVNGYIIKFARDIKQTNVYGQI